MANSCGTSVDSSILPAGTVVKVFSKKTNAWHVGRIVNSERPGYATIAFVIDGRLAIKHLLPHSQHLRITQERDALDNSEKVHPKTEGGAPVRGSECAAENDSEDPSSDRSWLPDVKRIPGLGSLTPAEFASAWHCKHRTDAIKPPPWLSNSFLLRGEEPACEACGDQRSYWPPF